MLQTSPENTVLAHLVRQPQLSVLVIPLGRAAREDQDLGTEDRACAAAAYHRPAVSCAGTLLPVIQGQVQHSLSSWFLFTTFSLFVKHPYYHGSLQMYLWFPWYSSVLHWDLLTSLFNVEFDLCWHSCKEFSLLKLTVTLGSYLSVSSFFSVHLAMSTMCIYLLWKRSSQNSLS